MTHAGSCIVAPLLITAWLLGAPASAAPASATAGLRPVAPGEVALGEFDTGDRAAAAWRAVAATFPADTAGKRQRVELSMREGRPRYRLVVAGFEGAAGAKAFCRRLVARGRTCSAAD
jgi:hypothetical protein